MDEGECGMYVTLKAAYSSERDNWPVLTGSRDLKRSYEHDEEPTLIAYNPDS